MPRISSPRPLDLTKPFVTSSQSYGSQPFDLSQNLVTWYRDIQGDFVPDLSGRGNTARCAGSASFLPVVASSDAPELNITQFDIRSFSFGGGAAGTEYPHIKTVNAVSSPTASIDHSFTDGTNDLPFSISFWIKPDAVSSQQYVISKINSAAPLSGYEWSVEILNGGPLRFIINGEGKASRYLQAQKNAAISAGAWQHVVLTYDGSASTSGISMYVNGSALTALTLSTSSGASAYVRMSKTSTPICIGNRFSSTSYATVSSEEYDGLIHSVAIWKNRKLTSSEIASLYNAYLNGPGGEARSGFISRSPRLQLRELDDLPGAYPTARRTGDSTRTGALASSFNDETTIIFSESGNVVFPSMLPKGSSFSSQAVDIVGQESDINASLPIRSFQQPNHLHYSPAEATGPFNENRVMPATEIFLSGTNPDILPGFFSPMRSKSQIEIDITPAADFTLTRNYATRNTHPGTADRSGFVYFNFNDKVWQDIGLIDPLNGSHLRHDIAINDKTSTFPVISGTENIVSQFSKSNTLIDYTLGSATGSISYIDLLSLYGANEETQIYIDLARSCCTPTIAFGAPNGSKYFATSSQVLKLSNISDPFLLEAISVQVDVETQCFFTASSVPYSDAAIYALPVNNYVFFLYSQRKTKRGNSISSDEISGSTRSIIASASVSFYHSGGSSPQNSPVLSIPVTSSTPFYPTNVPVVTQFTGTLDFTFYPNTCGEAWTIFDLPAYTGSTPSLTTRTLQGYWPGGSSATLDGNSWTSLKSSISANPVLSQFGASGSLARENVSIVLDPRHHRSVGGESQAQVYSDLSSLNYSTASLSRSNSRSVSPYLLMPGDEIILGIEKIHFDHYAIANVSTNFELYQSSSMTIKSNKSKITLHGSRIQNQKEILSSLNQNLSSNSVHEIVGATPQLDQFQVEPISSYYGSYLDEIVTGSMATPALGGLIFSAEDQDHSRRVISRVSLGQAGVTGSLQRFVKMSDKSERSYDSCLPNYADFLNGSSKLSVSQFTNTTYNIVNFERISVEYSDFEAAILEKNDFLPNQFPFKLNPTRRVDVPRGFIQNNNVPVGFTYLDLVVATDDTDTARQNGFMVTRDLIFRTNYNYHKNYLNATPYSYGHKIGSGSSGASLVNEKAGAFRYGISNVEPDFTACCWRTDRYGQFRDMLEPRQLTARFDGFNPVKVRFISGSTVLADPTETHSQNISVFATSSMPYFDDGIARNRSDNPDESLLNLFTIAT